MPTYKYKVRDKDGRAITDVMSSENETAVIESLKKMGYIPINVKPYKEKKALLNVRLNFLEMVKDEDMLLFTRQIATLLKAGIPLLSGLEAVAQQTSCTVLKETIRKIGKDIEAGSSFSEGLSKYPKFFSQLYVNMIKVGEASGTLDNIMQRLAELKEYDIDIKAKIKAAVRYPIITFFTLVAAFIVLVTFVIPRFATLFAQFKVPLPLPTRVLLLIYDIIHNFWHITLVLIVAVIVGFIKFINTSFGRARWDMLKIKVIIFGPLLLKIYLSRFTRTVSILVSSGIDMLQTLSLSADTVGNVIIAKALKAVREGLSEGTGMAAPMKTTRLFTPMVIQMVSIGEETGKLDELLMRASEYYEQEVDYTMKNLTTMIEPLFIFILGFMVLFVALAIFLPLWNLIQLYKTSMG